MTLGTESRIAQTWATRRKAFTAAVTTAIATWFAITAKAWLIAKLTTGPAIATAANRGNFGTFLAWSVITAHGHHRAGCGFGFDGGSFSHGLCRHCSI
jgi:hypothetical protein